jgi:TRAP-type mannitol/chloroaromatic compound transport system substrate-binding protein
MKRKAFFSLVVALLTMSFLIVSVAPPAQAAGPVKVKFQSAWAPSITLWRPDKYWVNLVNTLAAGELEIQYFDGGTLITQVPELFDAVAKGTLDMATDWPSYWEGKNEAFSLITSYPDWMNPGDYMLWYWQGGGLELAQELYGKYGIVWIPHGVTGPECGMRTNKIVKTGDDYKGLKMRQCGRIQAKILNDMGGSAIFMGGADIYLALSRGTIDAAEFSVPEVDWSMGLHEVTKNWVLPGWHQPGPLWGVMINKKVYDSLSDKVKFILKEAAMASMMWGWTYYEYSSADYAKRMADKGIQITRLDDATLDKIQDFAYKYMLEDSDKNPDYAKIAFAQARYFKYFDIWRSGQRPFMFGRTPPKLDEVLPKLEAAAKKHKVYDAVIALEKKMRATMEKEEFWKPGTKYEGNPVPVK